MDSDFPVGFVIGACLMTLLCMVALPDCGSNFHREKSCQQVCAPGSVHNFDRAMCVCANGKTHAGQFPKFYR